MTGLGNQTQNVALERSLKAMGPFFQTFADLLRLRGTVELFQSKVREIQNRWRCKAILDGTRVRILQDVWEAKLAELIQKYDKKGKKFHGFVRKLRLIDEKKRDSILKRYYDDSKRKHLTEMTRWMRRGTTLRSVWMAQEIGDRAAG